MQRGISSSKESECRPCLHFRKVVGPRVVALGRCSCPVDIERREDDDITTLELTWSHLSPGIDTSTCTCDLKVEESYQTSDASTDLCFPLVCAIESNDFLDLREFTTVLFEEYDCRLMQVQISRLESSECRITLLFEHGSERSVAYTRKHLQKFKDTVLKPSIHKWTQTIPVRKELLLQYSLPDTTSDQQREGSFSSLPVRTLSSGDSGLAASTLSSRSRRTSTPNPSPRPRGFPGSRRQHGSEPENENGHMSLPNLSDLTSDPFDGASEQAMAPISKNAHPSSVHELSSPDDRVGDRWKDAEAEQTMLKMGVTLPDTGVVTQNLPADSIASLGGAAAAEPAPSKSKSSWEDTSDVPQPARVIVQETDTSSAHHYPTISLDLDDRESLATVLSRFSSRQWIEFGRQYPGFLPPGESSPTGDESQPGSRSLSVDAPLSREKENKTLFSSSQSLGEDTRKHEETGTLMTGGDDREPTTTASGGDGSPQETSTEKAMGKVSATSSGRASDTHQADPVMTSEPVIDNVKENSADGRGQQDTHSAEDGAVATPHTLVSLQTTEVGRDNSTAGPSQSTEASGSLSSPSQQNQAVLTEVKQQPASHTTTLEFPPPSPQQGSEQPLSKELEEARPVTIKQSSGVGADAGLPLTGTEEHEVRGLSLSREESEAVSDTASEAVRSSGARRRTPRASAVPSTTSSDPRTRKLRFSLSLPTENPGGQERQKPVPPRKKSRSRRRNTERDAAYGEVEKQLSNMQGLLERQAREDSKRVRFLNDILELLINEFHAMKSPQGIGLGKDTSARIAELTQKFFASCDPSVPSGQHGVDGAASGQIGQTSLSNARVSDIRSDVTTTGRADVTMLHSTAPQDGPPGASVAATASSEWRQQGDVDRLQALPMTQASSSSQTRAVGQPDTPGQSSARLRAGSTPDQQTQHGSITQAQTFQSQGSGESAISHYGMSEMQLATESFGLTSSMHEQRSQETMPLKNRDSESVKGHTSSDQDIDPVARRLLNKVNVSETDVLLRVITRGLREEKPSPRAISVQTILCLDCSSSMGQAGLKVVKDAALDFLDGIEEEAENCGLEENIGVVTFGESTEVAQHLTVDYQAVRNAIENVTLGGRSPIFEALLVCLAAVGERGGTLRIGHTHNVHPRAIVFTDGRATGGESDSGPENNDSTPTHMRIALIQLINEINSPEHVSTVKPILWVPCGNVDKRFLTSLAQLGEGKYVEPSNIREHCSYYRFHDYLAKVMMLVKVTDGEMDEEMLKVYVDGVVTGMDEVEKAKLAAAVRQKILDKEKEPVDPRDFATVVEREGLPSVGSRVVRGPDWCYGNQDQEGPGTIIAHDDKDDWVWVMWDHGDYNRYCYDEKKRVKHIQVTDSPRLVKEGEPPTVGVEVIRGADWNHDNQDGGEGSIGVVIRVKDSGKVKVKWSNGSILNYRYGRNNKFEVKPAKILSVQGSPASKSEAIEGMHRRKSPEATPDVGPAAGPHRGALWQWRAGVGDTWQDYNPETTSRLEKAYRKNPRSTCLIDRAGQHRRVLFKSMKERDQDLQEHEVRRKVLDDASKGKESLAGSYGSQ